MKKGKQFQKKISRYMKKKKQSTSASLAFIINELQKSASLQSCILTDKNGLVLAEAIHRRDSKEHLAAAISLVSDTSNRIADYLSTSPVEVAFFMTKSHLLWVANVTIQKKSEQYLLLLLKPRTIFDSFTKNTLQLLEKEKVNISSFITIASNWLIKALS